MGIPRLPNAVRQAIRRSLSSRQAGEVVVISEVAAAEREIFASAELDPEVLEDAIAKEATQARLAIEFDVNAHKHH